MKLYNYHSSSTSFRVRIALNLKGLEYEQVPVELRWTGGDQHRPEYVELNPQANVPLLVDADGRFNQSLAIMEYLDEVRPNPPLLPKSAAERARVRALALYVACEIQPLNNLRTQRQLADAFGIDKPGLSRWQLHWCETGFDVLERELARSSATGRYCHGDEPTLADCCLVPQIYNSQRPVVGADLSKWPTLMRIYETCLAHPAFERAHPRKQPGFEAPSGH